MKAERYVLRGCLIAAALLAAPRAASAQVFSEELRVKGFWPDLALQFGGGFGLGHKLATPVMGRARLGALYAYEPLIINLGITGEVGALARRGVGAELELNHFGGMWFRGGFERVLGGDSMTHFTLGYMIFGVEWQHRFDSVPDNALLFVLRAPLGIWSFLLVDDANRRDRLRRQAHPQPPAPAPAAPREPPPPAPPATPPQPATAPAEQPAPSSEPHHD